MNLYVCRSYIYSYRIHRACSDNPRAWELLNTQFYLYVFYQRFKMKERRDRKAHYTIFIDVYASKVKIVWWKKEKSFLFHRKTERERVKKIYMDHIVLWLLSAAIAKSFLHTKCYSVYMHLYPKTLRIWLNFNQNDFFYSSFGEFISIIRIFIDIVSREIAQYSR